jgi:hypothetical protein
LWFSLAGLPLLALLRRPRGRRLGAWLGQHAGRRDAVLGWAVPLAVVHTALQAPDPVEHGWGEFVVFFDLFIAGALLLADQRLVGRGPPRPAAGAVCGGNREPGAGRGRRGRLLDQWPGDRSFSWTLVGRYSWRHPRAQATPPTPASRRPEERSSQSRLPWHDDRPRIGRTSGPGDTGPLAAS